MPPPHINELMSQLAGQSYSGQNTNEGVKTEFA